MAKDLSGKLENGNKVRIELSNNCSGGCSVMAIITDEHGQTVDHWYLFSINMEEGKVRGSKLRALPKDQFIVNKEGALKVRTDA